MTQAPRAAPHAGTFSPRPGAASYGAMVRAQASMETRLMLRHGEQLLLAVVIPVLALVGGVVGARRLGVTDDLGRATIDVLTPGVLALAVMSTAFTSLAIATGFERRYGLLKRLGASPLPRSGLLLGKVGALLVVQLVQWLVIGAVALALGWSPSLPGLLLTVPCALLGTAAFAGLGLTVAGVLRAEATLAVANLVYLLLLVGGAVVLPRSSYGAAGDALVLLPSAALGDALRGALLTGAPGVVPLLVLVGWALLGGALASRFFRWE